MTLKLLIAVFLLVGEDPADHSQTVVTDMKLAEMGCCIGAIPLIEGLAGLSARPCRGIVCKAQLLLLPGTWCTEMEGAAAEAEVAGCQTIACQNLSF